MALGNGDGDSHAHPREGEPGLRELHHRRYNILPTVALLTRRIHRLLDRPLVAVNLKTGARGASIQSK